MEQSRSFCALRSFGTILDFSGLVEAPEQSGLFCARALIERNRAAAVAKRRCRQEACGGEGRQCFLASMPGEGEQADAHSKHLQSCDVAWQPRLL